MMKKILLRDKHFNFSNRLINARHFLPAVCASIMISFVSCATVKHLPGNIDPVFITNTKSVNLLAPENISTLLDSMILLEIKFGSENFSVLSYVQADESGIFITLMNDFGTDMGTLEYDGNSIQLDCQLFPSNIKPEYIVADFQNAFYTAESLTTNLKASRLTFTEETAAADTDDNSNSTVTQDPVTVRKIFSGSKLIEEITIENAKINIKNYLRGYEYNLTVEE